MPLAYKPSGSTLVDQSRAQDFNLVVLQRLDSQIQEILYSATHVAVYEFDTKGKYWKRSNIEGTLFLVKRCVAPRCQIIVMNGKGTSNFYEEVDGSLETEMLETFLLYTKGNNQLYGIWFYENKNCDEFADYLNKILRGMHKPVRPGGVAAAGAGVDRGGGGEVGVVGMNVGGNNSNGNGGGGNGNGNGNGSGNGNGNGNGGAGAGGEIGGGFWEAQHKVGHPGGGMMMSAGGRNGPVGVVGGQVGGGDVGAGGAGSAHEMQHLTENGENQLMKLFIQAREKNPKTTDLGGQGGPGPVLPLAHVHVPQQAQQPLPPRPQPPPAAERPLAQAVAQQQQVQAQVQQQQQQQQPQQQHLISQSSPPGMMLQPRLPSPALCLPPAIATSPPQELGIVPPPPSVPAQFPLPPEFFKSSSELPGVNSLPQAPCVIAPDPNLLPMPSMPNLLGSGQSALTSPLSSDPMEGAQTNTRLLPPQYESGFTMEQSPDPQGLDRFFPTARRNGNTNAQSVPNNRLIEQARNKFRHVVSHLMQDDDFVDRFIAGFKKAGLDFS